MNDTRNEIRNYDIFNTYSKEKSVKIRNQIFNKYQYLAEIISKKYINKGVEYEDLYQIASIGLIYAIERYDVSRGFEFTSFATPTILGEIKKYFRDKGWSIKVPRRIQEISKKINIVNETLSFSLNRVPTVKEIADYLKYSEEEVLEAMEAGKLFTTQSLNVTYDSGSDSKEIELVDTIKDNKDSYEIFENNDFIKNSLNLLNELEKKIIIERFFNSKTQIEIAKNLNISQMTVSRLEKKALQKLNALVDK
ncbi:SigB/SigF/SigG family RNA polymerase sigma factor [Sedimentibacter sp. zth1]|uniref:SigB/SigF/SigG family RNA polymerase sigma factor n=1 Tax=Sedimentibacter sp. zth1 TaxID=2816908 RepID=UPI001F5F4B93|nr:SigB/SigF/SigG family RNA polymerase sigma factor [Sedimentibacter sp. zth1]